MTEFLSFLRHVLLLAGYTGTNEEFPDPLSGQEERECIEAMCNQGSAEAKNKLIEHNLRLVSHIAKKYVGTGEDLDDLITIGSLGLIKAVSSFRPEKGALSAYASRCIENEILMYLRSERRRQNSESSLEDPVGRDSDGNEVTIGERLYSCTEDVEEQAIRRVYHEKLDDAVQYALDDREREVIIMRYNLYGEQPLTQREVAHKIGVSRSYVSRIEKRALSKLARYIEDR